MAAKLTGLEIRDGAIDALLARLNAFLGEVSITGLTISTGTGTPEGAVTAAIGSLYLNLSGGGATTLYVKTSGAGNTGWTAK